MALLLGRALETVELLGCGSVASLNVGSSESFRHLRSFLNS